MTTRLFTTLLLICCACILPSYKDNCVEPGAGVCKVSVSEKNEGECPSTLSKKTVKADYQELEVYPLNIMSIEL
jgi:hypothetical protein